MTCAHVVKIFAKYGKFVEIKEQGKRFLENPYNLPCEAFNLLYNNAKVKSIVLYSDGQYNIQSYK